MVRYIQGVVGGRLKMGKEVRHGRTDYEDGTER